jgi:cellobiose phosphorylase
MLKWCAQGVFALLKFICIEDSMTKIGWHFIDDDGTFFLSDPDRTSALYFPLVNEAGMISSITPNGHGDAKTGHNSFLLQPVSVEDLHNSRSARNFWVRINGEDLWSALGNSAEQARNHFSGDQDAASLTAGFLWQVVSRIHSKTGLQAETTSFVPASTEDCVELLRVRFKNTGNIPLNLKPTAAIPMYGRSADNLRDHRHVTSLLHRITCTDHGVLVCPTLSFDERGHTVNTLIYAVLGVTEDGCPPEGFFPVLEDFTGEGGTLDWPEAVASDRISTCTAGSTAAGYEAFGGLQFKDVQLAPGQETSYILMMGVLKAGQVPDAIIQRYGSQAAFDQALAETNGFWLDKVSALRFETGDARQDGWLKWVVLQPTLRRLMGNSFLPYHDYGRGGRGWRDLWQDILALLMMEPVSVNELLLDNFAGVRADGSNATIIGSRPGEFTADRNGIPRVWMDHGAWPLLTTRLYLDQTGDLDFLLHEQVYYKDHQTHRCRQVDVEWTPEQGTLLLTADGEPYQGTVLEHLLIQHLTAFYNVGEHNNLLLEGADWNDAFDMARSRGESVSFSALYAGNLRSLSDLCLALDERGAHKLVLADELQVLLAPIDFDSVNDKRQRLQAYFDCVYHVLSGKKRLVPAKELAAKLSEMADWLKEHIRQHEWIEDGQGFGWFNGYYDEGGQRVEGIHSGRVRMTLTGQVFTMMCGIASAEQAQEIVRAADHYLYEPSLRGYRLNTNFDEVKLNLGRAFGFAFGHKENGAMFSHMAAMYANALYQRGMAAEGWRVLEGIYNQSQDFYHSRMYPGIPEYFSPRGRGMYTYLTGSASWYLLTLLTEVYGIKGVLGDLHLAPKLLASQFNASAQAVVHTLFAGKKLSVYYENAQNLNFGEYKIGQVCVEGEHELLSERTTEGVKIQRHLLASLPEKAVLRVYLIQK